MAAENIDLATLDAAIDFIMGHYEQGSPFRLTAVDPDEWWSKVQIEPHRPESLLPASRAHFEARKARWKELAREHFGVVG